MSRSLPHLLTARLLLQALDAEQAETSFSLVNWKRGL